MSGRPVSEVAAELVDHADFFERHDQPVLGEMLRGAAALLERLDDLLPTCPTCGGHERSGLLEDYYCPDCTDGKVSLARLVALWEAVWSDDGLMVMPKGPGVPGVIAATRAALRSVTP